VNGELRLTAKIAEVGQKNQLQPNPAEINKLAQLLTQFLQIATPQVSSPKELAQRMASLAQLIRDAINTALAETEKGGMLRDQLESFQKVLIKDLTRSQFADMYAQTICYGLFAARCNTDNSATNLANFSRETAAFQLPKTNPFLRSIFSQIAGPDLDDRIVWSVDELATILRLTDMAKILKNFGQRTRQEDPVVHFYETFLAEYDPKMRESRGVYYTPEPVVSYIVRSVDSVLKQKFGISRGLADARKIKVSDTPQGQAKEIHQVLILDPAVGTGTFLHGAIDHIYESFKEQKGMWSSYVSQHLLPRLFGFELLMAPYTVAHMKLGLQLQELGYDFSSDERLRIYLTNTLQEAFQIPPADGFLNRIRDEAAAAKKVKEDVPVMVILGNPPYAYESVNTDPWIVGLVRDYYQVDGEPLGERNPKGLLDDYVKFIRFAEHRIELTGYGVLAFITNHGYLDNPTFRGMRQHLMQTFDEIYLLDLHGNSKKKEVCPDGSPDQNVFDIQQGVAIGIFIKSANHPQKLATVYHADLWGKREIYREIEQVKEVIGGKYYWLAENDINSTEWIKIEPQTPYYLFKPQDTNLLSEYEQGWKISETMRVNSLGVVTARDKLTIHWTKDEAWQTVTQFANLSVEDARNTYNLGKDSSDWKVNLAQKDLKQSVLDSNNLVPIFYRPFDLRYTYYTGKSGGFHCRPRGEVMNHIIAGNNLAICTNRQVNNNFSHIFVTKSITDGCAVSLATRERTYIFPLYLYPTNEPTLFDLTTSNAPGGRRPNLAEEFTQNFATRLKLAYISDGKGDKIKTFGPEDIFNYIYAVFHSPTYRERYAEFLKIDFPRVPLTANIALFQGLCNKGDRLVNLHLMKQTGSLRVTYPEPGDNQVEKVCYTEPKKNQPGRVYLNKTQYFEGVPPEVWHFYIGGYQVCQKWLKDRQGRILDYDDLTHYQNIVAALAETIILMQEIDALITKHGGFPIH
jgi:predicted helicase